MNTLLLNKSQVKSLIHLDRIRDTVEQGYCSFNSGNVLQPDFLNLVKPGTHIGFDFKLGYNMEQEVISMKSSSGGYTNNPSLGLPTGMNMVYLYDGATSALKCIMDGTWITGCRTAAAGAISVKYLSRKDSTSLAMIGAGGQARNQLRAILRIRDIQEVYIFSYSPEHVTEYIREMSAETGLHFTACKTAEEAIRQADIVVTTTRGRKGLVVKKQWLKPGTHIAAIGADVSDKQEIDAEVFKGAKIVNDSTKLCLKNGDTHHAVDNQVISADDIYGEIGEIISGKKNGRENDTELTIFDSVGMAVQDIAMASAIYTEAIEKGIGTYFDFYE